MKIKRRMIFTAIALAFALCLPLGLTAFADSAEKTVDGRTWRWEQEAGADDNLADLNYDTAGDKVTLSGSGYRERAGMKFGFRCNVGVSVDDCGLTLQFPEFPELYSDEHEVNGKKVNLHYVAALTNTFTRWWNTNDNATKSIGILIRPVAQNTVTVNVVGRFAIGDNGYDDYVSDHEKPDEPSSKIMPQEVELDADRKITVGIKDVSEEGETMYALYVNGERFYDLDRQIYSNNDKTASDMIKENFADKTAYWHFGASREQDANNEITLAYSVTHMYGTTDAFIDEPVPDLPSDDGDDTVVLPSVKEGGKSDVNLFYVIYYPLIALVGAGAIVCFVLYFVSGKKSKSA